MIPSPLLVVTDRRVAARPLVETVRAALDGGARWIWFRDKDLERAARKDLALELLDLVRAASGQLTVGGDAALASEIGADGVQLGMDAVAEWLADASPRSKGGSVIASVSGAIPGPRATIGVFALDCFVHARNDGDGPVGSRGSSGTDTESVPLTGISAHGLGDIRRAAEAGAAYVTLSPIFPSASKPGYGPALGLDALREAAAFGVPVIALGGVAPERAAACRATGAAGVAVMGAVMAAADPAAATRRFVAALGGAT